MKNEEKTRIVCVITAFHAGDRGSNHRGEAKTKKRLLLIDSLFLFSTMNRQTLNKHPKY
jgi:hypothetical protein